MAEEEPRDRPKRSDRRDPARNARRNPPVIEGKAEELTPAAGTVPSKAMVPVSPPEAETIEPETPPVPPEADTVGTAQDPVAAVSSELSDAIRAGEAPTDTAAPPPRDPVSETPRQADRSNWGTLAAVGFVVLAAGLLYLFYQISSLPSLPPDNSAAVSDLKSRLAAVESRPAPDASGLGDRFAKLEDAVGGIRGGLAALDKRVDSLAGTVSAQPNVAGQVADLQAAVAGLKTSVAGVVSSVAALPRPDIGRIEARVGDLDQRVSGLQGSVSSIPHVDLGPLTSKVDALEGRLKPIEAETNAAQSPEQVAQRRAAPVAVTAQAIAGAIDAGEAFPKEFQALQALGTDPVKLAPLQAVAENGAPSLRDLQATLAELRDRIVTQGAAPANGSYVDRLVAGASSLVQVRPLGSVVGDTPSAIAARLNDDIAGDDLAAAMAEWRKLPETSQSASKALADRIKLRLDAERAAHDIAANAIEAMALPRG